MERISRLIEIAKKVTSDEATAQKYADHLSELIDAIDPERIGADYANALEVENYALACDLLVAYYRAKPRNTISELSAIGSYDIAMADKTVEGYVTVCEVEWKFENGNFDYFFNPTEIEGPVNHEWLWQLGRHYFWPNLAYAYVGTGDEKYALAFEKQLLRWIEQSYVPEKWNAPRSTWRTIECGIRLLGSWQVAFDGFIRSTKICGISMLLMIASMLRQTRHLVAHPTKRNWIMMEMNGVYTFSSIFDELKCAKENRTIATEHLLRELSEQILPDGMHNELSPDYQCVVLNCSANFYSIAQAFGREKEVPKEFSDLIIANANAAIKLSTPALIQPLTNDCHYIYTSAFTRRVAKLFGDRPEWTFISTERASGHMPEGENASAFMNYAGFAVMRNDWSADSAYLCFDVGPLGAGHWHQDKLNIILYKGDEELIFDDGGGNYEKSELRQYAISGYDHNTILVDSMAQNRTVPNQVSEPIDAGWISNSTFDYAAGVYDDTFGIEMLSPAIHKREVRFCKPDFFCVTDTLTSRDGKAHDYELLFHLDTTKVRFLDEYKNGVISDCGKKYDIVIIPLDPDGIDVSVKAVSGQTEPYFRGWYRGNRERDVHKATTLSREVKDVKDHRFTTLLFPIERGGKLPTIEKINGGKLKIHFNSKEYELDINKLYE